MLGKQGLEQLDGEADAHSCVRGDDLDADVSGVLQLAEVTLNCPAAASQGEGQVAHRDLAFSRIAVTLVGVLGDFAAATARAVAQIRIIVNGGRELWREAAVVGPPRYERFLFGGQVAGAQRTFATQRISPLVMRNPRPKKGHTNTRAKTLASGLLFCHVGIVQVVNTANQNLKEGPLSSGFFCF
jgi:hypothetical protein